ncbi:MAG: subtilisin-like proprotein convertase family protein [Myxococcota bacterium]|jgi:subtilisin-like proprotein convertase family protein
MATVSVDLVVTLDIDHPRPADLTVTLYNPYGTSGTVVSGSDTVDGDHIVRAIPSDEVANGDWSITIVDSVSGQEGTLESWSLYMISIYD